jgi:hypothetical protein
MLRWVVTGYSLSRPKLKASVAYVGFVLDRVAVGQNLFQFVLSLLLTHLSSGTGTTGSSFKSAIHKLC